MSMMMMKLPTLARAALTSVLVLGATFGAVPAHAQMFNRPIARPSMPTPNTPLSPNQQMQLQSEANILGNRARQQESLGAAGATAALRTQERLNGVMLQQSQSR
jgi:hypothetical protein